MIKSINYNANSHKKETYLPIHNVLKIKKNKKIKYVLNLIGIKNDNKSI